MLQIIRHDSQGHEALAKAGKTNMDVCYTCRTCAAACPVNMATGGRLSPIRLIRLAVYGLLDELLNSKEIWYCLQCNSCNQGCPMGVKPASLIYFLRNEVIRRRLINEERWRHYTSVWARFQRVRWHAADLCLKDQEISLNMSTWRRWQEEVIKPGNGHIYLQEGQGTVKAEASAGASSCFTCNECRCACPVYYERNVFDPLAIIRLRNMGLQERVLSSPSLWLCLSCRRCSETCCQKVAGHLVIRQLQEAALAQGLASKDFSRHWLETQRALYPYLLTDIDEAMNF